MTFTAADFHVNETNTSPEDIADLNSALSYLSTNSMIAANVLQQLIDKGTVINIIHNGDDRYNGTTNAINWDPKSGLVVLDDKQNIIGTQSAALGLIHEGGHAIDPNFTTDNVPDGTVYFTAGEKFVITQVEDPVAAQLGELQRTNHFGDADIESNSIDTSTQDITGFYFLDSFNTHIFSITPGNFSIANQLSTGLNQMPAGKITLTDGNQQYIVQSTLVHPVINGKKTDVIQFTISNGLENITLPTSVTNLSFTSGQLQALSPGQISVFVGQNSSNVVDANGVSLFTLGGNTNVSFTSDTTFSTTGPLVLANGTTFVPQSSSNLTLARNGAGNALLLISPSANGSVMESAGARVNLSTGAAFVFSGDVAVQIAAGSSIAQSSSGTFTIAGTLLSGGTIALTLNVNQSVGGIITNQAGQSVNFQLAAPDALGARAEILTIGSGDSAVTFTGTVGGALNGTVATVNGVAVDPAFALALQAQGFDLNALLQGQLGSTGGVVVSNQGGTLTLTSLDQHTTVQVTPPSDGSLLASGTLITNATTTSGLALTESFALTGANAANPPLTSVAIADTADPANPPITIGFTAGANGVPQASLVDGFALTPLQSQLLDFFNLPLGALPNGTAPIQGSTTNADGSLSFVKPDGTVITLAKDGSFSAAGLNAEGQLVEFTLPAPDATGTSAASYTVTVDGQPFTGQLTATAGGLQGTGPLITTPPSVAEGLAATVGGAVLSQLTDLLAQGNIPVGLLLQAVDSTIVAEVTQAFNPPPVLPPGQSPPTVGGEFGQGLENAVAGFVGSELGVLFAKE